MLDACVSAIAVADLMGEPARNVVDAVKRNVLT